MSRQDQGKKQSTDIIKFHWLGWLRETLGTVIKHGKSSRRADVCYMLTESAYKWFNLTVWNMRREKNCCSILTQTANTKLVANLTMMPVKKSTCFPGVSEHVTRWTRFKTKTFVVFLCYICFLCHVSWIHSNTSIIYSQYKLVRWQFKSVNNHFSPDYNITQTIE